MTYKTNIDPDERAFYFATSGEDFWSGKTFETPKKTIQVAIDAGIALNPGFGNEVRIKEAQGGAYIGDIVLADSVFFEGTLTSIVGSGPVACTLSSFASFVAQAVVSFTDDSTVLKIDGLTAPSPMVTAVQALGLRVVCLDITGSCDRVFHNNLEMVLARDDCIGVRCDASSPTPIDLNYETVAMNGDNCTFVEWNQPGALDVGVIQVSTVEETGSGGLSIHTLATNLGSLVVTAGIISADILAEGGGLVLDAHVLNADTRVKTGAMVTYKSIGVALGNIEVDPGGTLNIENPLRVSGNITPSDPGDGRINGTINNVRFGNARVLDEIVLSGTDFTQQDPPVGPGSEMQVSFGGAQSNSVVSVDALGTMTVHKIAQLKFKFALQPGRDNAGGIAFLFFRLLVDGAQEGEVKFIKLDGPNDDVYMEINIDPLDLIVDQEVKLIMVRGVSGMDDGSLMSENPLQSGWTSSTSATVTVIRTN